MTEEQLEKRREKWRRYYYRHPDRSKARRIKSQEKNADFVDSFKTECARCGFNDKRALDFHHRDRSTKTQSVGSMRVAGYKLERIKEEIDKCDVLCANCHRILHFEEEHNE